MSGIVKLGYDATFTLSAALSSSVCFFHLLTVKGYCICNIILSVIEVSSSYLICSLICIFTLVKCSTKNFSVSSGVTSIIAVLMVVALIGDLNDGTSGMEIKSSR